MKIKSSLLVCLTIIIITAFTVKDPFAGYTWKTIKAQGTPMATEENDFVNLNGLFYMVGGRTKQKMSVFNPTNNTWTFASAPPLELHHFQAITLNDEIYVCAGMTGNYPHEQPVPNFYIYTPESDSWSKGPEMPSDRLRGSCGVAVYKGKIYIVSGIQDGHWTGSVTWFDEYDPKTNTWKKLPDAPTARDHFNVAIVKDKLYCIAGRKSNGLEKRVFEETTDQVDIFDFKTGKWSTAEAKLPTVRGGANLVAVGDEILVIGGESAAQLKSHSDVEAFNVKTQQFRKLPGLVEGRHATGALLYKGKIYTTGGVGNRGGSPRLTSIEVFSADK